MRENSKNSVLGIISTVIALFFWAYMLILGYLLFYTTLFNSDPSQNLSFLEEGGIMLLLVFFYLVIPAIGFGVGLILALVGLFVTKNRKRAFAVVGLILSVTPFILTVIYNLK